MEEQNRLRLEISEERLELKEFSDEMREETRYEDEEISKSQAEINEKLYRFKAEIKGEVAQFRAQIRAQHNEAMADIHSKLNRLMGLLQDRKKSEGLEPPDLFEAPLVTSNSNREEPTLVSVADQLQAFNDSDSGSEATTENPDDEVLKVNACDSYQQPFSFKPEVAKVMYKVFDEMSHPNSVEVMEIQGDWSVSKSKLGDITQSITLNVVDDSPEDANMDETRNEEELKIMDDIAPNTTQVSTNGSPKWVRGVTSRMDAVLGENAMKEDAHLMFDKMTKAMPVNVFEVDKGMASNQNNNAVIFAKAQWCWDSLGENDWMYTTFIQCKNVDSLIAIEVMFYFDPGGCSWSQIGCDTFEFDGKHGDYCLATIMADAGVQAVTHKIWIIIASVCGVIFLIDRAFFKNGLDTLIEIGTGQMGYYVDEFFEDYSFPNKTIKGNTLWLEELGVDIAVVVVKNVTKEKRIVEASVLNKMISSVGIGVLVPTRISILRNSLFDLLHNMDTTNGVVMTLGVLIILKGAKVHWFLSPHPKDVISTSLHISPSLEVAYEEIERALTWVSNKVDKGFKMRKGFMLTKSQSATWIQCLKHCKLLTWKQIQEFPKELFLGVQQIVARFENSTSIVLMSLGVGASHTNFSVQIDAMSRKAIQLVIFMCQYSWGIIDETEAVEDKKPFSFLIAYLTYMPISNIREVCFEGWEPLHLPDNHSHREHSNGLGNVLIFEFEADRVYHSSWDMIASRDHGNTEKNRVVVSLCRLLEGQEGRLGLSEVSTNCTTYVKLFPLHKKKWILHVCMGSGCMCHFRLHP